jgi:hypothetical protein
LLAKGDRAASALRFRDSGDIAALLHAGMEAGGLLLDGTQLDERFFDLRTGLAGELFQKFTNYRVRLAIVIIDARAYGGRFSELVREHAGHATVRFFPDEQLARQWLAYNPVVRC